MLPMSQAKTNLFTIDGNVLPTVAKNFDKTEQSLKENVEEVKDWIRTQSHFPEIMSDTSIQNFLLLNKCNVEKTRRKLEEYYTIRSKLPCLFEKSNPKSNVMQEVMDAVYFVPLPKLTEDMYRVMIHRVKNKDKFNYLHPYDITAHALNLLELRLNEDVCFGDIYIIDCRDLPIRYYLKTTPRCLYNVMVKVYQGVYSARLKAAYVINAPVIIEKIMAIIKLLLKPKLFERIHLCTEDTLKETFLNILPREYDGKEKSLEELQDMLNAKFREYEHRFDKLDQMRDNKNRIQNRTIFGFTY